MALFNFRSKSEEIFSTSAATEALLANYSIEVMPRTAEKVEDFRPLLPQHTRVYIAHIEGTPIDDMVATAKRLSDEGYSAMPHFPARIIKNKTILQDWISRYRNEAGVK
ncbi:MAG: methylenetetrahydrofolate reductase, partial [Paracoccaceae bacterium]